MKVGALCIKKEGAHFDTPSFAEAGGFEPPVRLPVRQFSKLVVSATHPNFLLIRVSCSCPCRSFTFIWRSAALASVTSCSLERLGEEISPCVHVFSFCLSASIAYDRMAVTRIRFPFSPKLWGIVSIGSAGSSQYCAQGSNVVVGKPTGTVYFNPGGISSNLEQAMSWSGNTVRWYNTSREWYQLNALGATYYYFAFS